MATEEVRLLPSQQRRVIDRDGRAPSLAVRSASPAALRQGGSHRAAGRRPLWQRRYVRSIVAGDAVAALLAALTGWVVRFGDGLHTASMAGLSVAWTMVLLPPIWVVAMMFFRAYEPRFLAVGSEEFQRVLLAGTTVVALVGTASWAFQLDVARGFVVVALPLAGVLTVLGRLGARHLLHRRRAAGDCMQSTVVAGHPRAVAALVRQVRRNTDHGLRVDAVCTPGGASSPELDALGVPVLGTLEEIAAVARKADADVVATLTCPELDGPVLRRLGWELEDTRADLVVAPALTDIVGPRVVIRPVSGLPLLHVDRPELRGIRHVGKALFDRGSAALGLLVLSPLFLLVAVLVKLDSPGPVFFRQTRVGRDGTEFSMVKFRSMVTDAEKLLIDLRAQSEGNGLLFKMRRDPRVTRVGHVLRRYSLDELPQLLNVVGGSMSLVGPRPPLPAEVAAYGEDLRRRLLVKPGLTGLWQVSGRSDLDLEESTRLDLQYVENWSPAFDVMILAKTAQAVFTGRGAY
ncbi:exopolysaccharide biosynthesis polyprenyl glycosylphosphotransferase [Kineococcus radiotolerans]|uniref:Exopolysaccharide biosynthesis polyprenyl glycosylphosphotransferase n=1 Tax=Kineococcus radiotolerans TaxID=131568 RepID=A0A7W4XXZ7_KINRA|nr:sugar transferase [Kineococcus radiotolerans]MBB2902012.1 exopolysaccharide biosynthesis polyprenyl glycosylphosphotransferase [Kineococcus radiotolerans]